MLVVSTSQDSNFDFSKSSLKFSRQKTPESYLSIDINMLIDSHLGLPGIEIIDFLLKLHFIFQ